jgi:multidrug resistance efflux pump
MTLAEQIKSAVTAAISDLRAALVKPAAPATPSNPPPAASISDEVRAEITSALSASYTASITSMQTELTQATTELTQAKADLATAKQTISTLQTASTSKDAKIAEHEATITNPKGRIEQLASHKALEIAGAQGVPALNVKPVENPAAPASNTAGLKGRARLEAGISAELNKTFPAAKPGN